MSQATLSWSEIERLICQYWWSTMLFLISAVVGALLLTRWVPPKYKAVSTLSVSSGYFKNPLVSDIVSEEYDQGELRAQREAILRGALSNAFVDRLLRDYSLETPDTRPQGRALQRELMRKRIEYFPLNGSTFQLNTVSRSASEAYEMNRVTLAHVLAYFSEHRRALLENSRIAIEEHVHSVGRTLKEVASAKGRVTPESVREDLRQVRADLEVSRLSYSDKHPEVFELQRKVQRLETLLRSLESEEKSRAAEGSLAYVGPAAQKPMEDLYNELLKKLSYLDIVISMEQGGESHISIVDQPRLPTTPFFPRRAVFAVFGLLVGLVFSAVYAAFCELRRLAQVDPGEISEALGLPFLGEVPALAGTAVQHLLEGPRATGVQQSLPQP